MAKCAEFNCPAIDEVEGGGGLAKFDLFAYGTIADCFDNCKPANMNDITFDNTTNTCLDAT